MWDLQQNPKMSIPFFASGGKCHDLNLSARPYWEGQQMKEARGFQMEMGHN
jgi:hypothetical protein